MEYQAISEPGQMKALEMLFRALLLGSLLVSVMAVGVVACLCLVEWMPLKPSRRSTARRLPREAEALLPPGGSR
jgi:hypothetical protein